ncbi:MAG: cytochrome c [Epsilonproteobacteria bacterium]|nr:MAG: cytochrome c [Campylobacterota bacterium]
MKVLIIFTLLLFVSCDRNTAANKESSIALGKTTFANNCAICHGDKAQSTVDDWRKPLPNGSYPAPPLDGTAHTWHHSPKSLLGTINNGGAEFKGWMPAFKDKLSDDEKQALIDYIYDLWPKEIKKQYDKRFK